MTREDQRELDEALIEGFLADRLVSLIDRGGALDPTSSEVLSRALQRLEMVLSGQETVDSGRLSSSALESIQAYSRAIQASALHLASDEQFSEKFRSMISQVRKEISTSLKKGEVIPERMKETRKFFQNVRKATLSKSAMFFREGANPPGWLRTSP